MAYEDVFDQRKWPHCTLFAISLAVSKACDDHRVEITSLDVRTALFQHKDIYKKVKTGFCPKDFDGKTLTVYNRNPDANEFLTYTIKIDKIAINNFRREQPATRHVLVVWRYLNGDEDHCMYVIDQVVENGVKCFKCHNSMREGGREPTVVASQNKNKLHRVILTVNDRIPLNAS